MTYLSGMQGSGRPTKKHMKMYEGQVLVLLQLIYINTLIPTTRLSGILLGLNGIKEMHHGVNLGKGVMVGGYGDMEWLCRRFRDSRDTISKKFIFKIRFVRSNLCVLRSGQWTVSHVRHPRCCAECLLAKRSPRRPGRADDPHYSAL